MQAGTLEAPEALARVVVKDVYLDDERETPEGWYRCRYVWEVVALIKANEVRRLSLDHDLGTYPDGHYCRTGLDLVLWMVENCRWPREKPLVHSANPVGAEAMRFLIDKWFGREYCYENR